MTGNAGNCARVRVPKAIHGAHKHRRAVRRSNGARVRQTQGLLALVSLAAPALATADMDNSSGLWTLAGLRAPVTNQWSLNLETDFRVLDNFRETTEMIVQPAVLFNVNEHWTVALGYTLDVKPPSENENRIIADGTYHFTIRDKVVLGNRARFNPRFIDNVGPVIRLRYRISATWQIKQTPAYLHHWNEVFFNANDQGEGPVQGFEQNRLVPAAVGYHFGDYLRADIGYMWRPERRRGQNTVNDHIVAVSLLFTTAKKLERNPLTNEAALPVAR